jgi:hypothetical protein
MNQTVFVLLTGACRFRQELHGYRGGWQSYTNCPARTEILTPGTTHVAIGFVDLSNLAAACEMMAARHPEYAKAGLGAVADTEGSGHQAFSTSSSSSSSGGGGGGGGGLPPLRWVGYEASAPCVAKTLVLLQMVRQGAAVDEVLQVGSLRLFKPTYIHRMSDRAYNLCHINAQTP